MEPIICRECGRVHLNYTEWLEYHGNEYNQPTEEEMNELVKFLEKNVEPNVEEE